MASVFLIVSIRGFNISITDASTYGIKLANLTTDVILAGLGLVLYYHAIAFFIRAYEEYRHWELSLGDTIESGYMERQTTIIDLSERLSSLAETIEKITENGGLLNQAGQTIFTNDDANKLRDATNAANQYAIRFKNFPNITRYRFWLWDVGIAIITTIVASLFLFSCIQSGSLIVN